MSADNQTALIVREKKITEDANGLIKLNDIFALAGAPKNKRPNDWSRGSAQDLIERLWERVTGKSRNAQNTTFESVFYTSRGRGTFAHPILAVAYSAYLDKDLEIEMLEVWLRFRAGDRSLANEILARAKDEVQKWHDTRDVSKAVRNKYTATLADHGAKGAIGYCTDAIYIELLGGTAKSVASDRKLPAKANLRDTLPLGELLQTMNTEFMASERIEDLATWQRALRRSVTALGAYREGSVRPREEGSRRA